MGFFWCLRDSIASAGYNTAPEFEKFCKQTTQEIDAALKSGNLQKRDGPSMPSALMSPWKTLICMSYRRLFLEVFEFVASNEGFSVVAAEVLVMPEESIL